MIENLRRVGVHVAAGRRDRNLADAWADEITAIAEKDPKSLVLVIADMARSDPPMTTPFISELARRLQGQGPALALPLTWIEQRLAESNQTIDQMVQLGNQQQAADQVSISNSINSLRTLGAIDWREFVESHQRCRTDIARRSGRDLWRMDFASRDRYRHVVERLARASPFSEVEVARKALQIGARCRGNGKANGNDATMGSCRILSRSTRDCLSLRRQHRSIFPEGENPAGRPRGRPLLFYLGAIALITLGLVPGLLLKAYADGASGLAAGLAGWNPVSIRDESACRGAGQLDGFFAGDAPFAAAHGFFQAEYLPPFRTLVVVPTLLTNEPEIENLVEALEVRFLANRDDNL